LASDRNRLFGRRVRALRKARGLTLVELAGASGLAASTLSKVENGHISLTYDNLIRLADGLAVDLARLIEPAGDSPSGAPPSGRPMARFTVTRAQERPKLPIDVYGYEPLVTGLTHKLMDPTFVRVKARQVEDFPRLIAHPGEEFVYVLSGAIEVHTEHYAPTRLEAGDCVYFDAGMGHAYVTVSEEDATILNICAGAHGSEPILEAVRNARNDKVGNDGAGSGKAGKAREKAEEKA
jgi:transcriptional regulator with XRE-family HTH domain